MKYFILLICLSWMGCVSKRKLINPDEIVKVYVLFNDLSKFRNQSYYLPDGQPVPYDVKQIGVKAALAANLPKVKELPVGDLAEIKMIFKNSMHQPYYAIKVRPLNQFGYLETTTGKYIHFGISDHKVLIDLDNDRVYYSRDLLKRVQ